MNTTIQRPKCAACAGAGSILGFFDDEVECDTCDGTGYELDLDPYADSEWAGGVE